MDFTDYAKILKFVFSEELERIDEFLYSVENDYDCNVEKPWILDMEFVPSKDQLEMLMISHNRDIQKDLITITTVDWASDEGEKLYLELRDILCS